MSPIPIVMAKSIRVYLKDYRFLFALVGVFVLMSASGWLFAEDHAYQLERFNKLRALSEESRNLERVYVPQNPSRLGFLARETRDQFLDYAVVRPYLTDVPSPEVSERPLVRSSQTLDWYWIVVYFHGFMAMALVYDAVSGEKESGTLKMSFSKPLTRTAYLVARFLGAYVATLLPFTLGVAAHHLVLSAYGFHLQGEEYFTSFIAVLVVADFLAFQTLLGLVVSVSCRRAASSLALASCAWLVLAFLLPTVTSAISTVARDVPTQRDFQRDMIRLTHEMHQDVAVDSRWLQRVIELPGLSAAEKRARIADLEARLREDHEARLSRHEIAVARLRADYLSKIAAQFELESQLAVVSPYALFGRMLEQLAQSKWSGRTAFLRSVDEYQRSYTRFVEESRKTYRSQASISAMRVEMEASDGEVYRLSSVGGVSYADVRVDGRSFPKYENRAYSETIRSELLDSVFVLSLYQVVLALVAWRGFRHYDLR